MTPTCAEHTKFAIAQAELLVMFKDHAENMKKSLDTIIRCLQGEPGVAGLTERVGKLETHVCDLTKVIQGNGSTGLVGRMGKLERVWAMLIGVAIASGAAGAGFWKLLSLW